jgi:hypothetical protein
MDEREELRLKTQKQIAEEYEVLRNLPAWKNIEADMIRDYQDNLTRMIYADKDDPLSRAILQGIEYIFEKIGKAISLGDIARERLFAEQNKQNQKGKDYVE